MNISKEDRRADVFRQELAYNLDYLNDHLKAGWTVDNEGRWVAPTAFPEE